MSKPTNYAHTFERMYDWCFPSSHFVSMATTHLVLKIVTFYDSHHKCNS